MSFILRSVRKTRWDRDSYKRLEWLGSETPADPFADVTVERGILSVWVIEDDRSNINEVALAMSTNRTSISHFDYRLIDIKHLNEAGFKLETVTGNTAYGGANHWHRDIVELSARRLLELLNLFWDFGESRRIPEKPMAARLKQALRDGQLDKARINQGLLPKLRS